MLVKLKQKPQRRDIGQNKSSAIFFCKITNPYFLGRQKGEEGKITKIKRETLATFSLPTKEVCYHHLFLMPHDKKGLRLVLESLSYK